MNKIINQLSSLIIVLLPVQLSANNILLYAGTGKNQIFGNSLMQEHEDLYTGPFGDPLPLLSVPQSFSRNISSGSIENYQIGLEAEKNSIIFRLLFFQNYMNDGGTFNSKSYTINTLKITNSRIVRSSDNRFGLNYSVGFLLPQNDRIRIFPGFSLFHRKIKSDIVGSGFDINTQTNALNYPSVLTQSKHRSGMILFRLSLSAEWEALENLTLLFNTWILAPNRARHSYEYQLRKQVPGAGIDNGTGEFLFRADNDYYKEHFAWMLSFSLRYKVSSEFSFVITVKNEFWKETPQEIGFDKSFFYRSTGGADISQVYNRLILNEYITDQLIYKDSRRYERLIFEAGLLMHVDLH